MSPPIEKSETFEPGEEVVVRLDAVKALRVEGAGALPASLPAWTIAEVLARRDGEGGTVYDVRFRHRRQVYVAEIDAASIEGTA